MIADKILAQRPWIVTSPLPLPGIYKFPVIRPISAAMAYIETRNRKKMMMQPT
jgi:hypothetical protein